MGREETALGKNERDVLVREWSRSAKKRRTNALLLMRSLDVRKPRWRGSGSNNYSNNNHSSKNWKLMLWALGKAKSWVFRSVQHLRPPDR